MWEKGIRASGTELYIRIIDLSATKAFSPGFSAGSVASSNICATCKIIGIQNFLSNEQS